MLVHGILVSDPEINDDSWNFWNDTPLCVSSNITIIKEPVKSKEYKKKSKILNLKNNINDLIYINEKIKKPKKAYRNSR